MFGIKEHRFQYAVTTEEAARKLGDVLKQSGFDSIVAHVTPAKVKLYKRPPALLQNSFNPVFVGRFRPSAAGSVLVGRFRASWYTLGFVVVFFAMIGYNLLDAYLQPEVRPGYVAGWRAREIQWQLEFLGFALGLPIVGWLFGLPSKNAIVRAIEASIQQHAPG